jgi:hypothetical protein
MRLYAKYALRITLASLGVNLITYWNCSVKSQFSALLWGIGGRKFEFLTPPWPHLSSTFALENIELAPF